MRKLLMILSVVLTMSSCDDTEEMIQTEVELANYSYEALEQSISSAVENAKTMCDEIEDEDLRFRIMEQLDIISSTLENEGSKISVDLKNALERMMKNQEYEQE